MRGPRWTDGLAATASAGLTWALIGWSHIGTPTIRVTATDAVAGLVAIIPACGFVNPMNAMFMGIIVAFVRDTAVAMIKGKFGSGDSLDAFGVRGVGGTIGTILRASSPGKRSMRKAPTDCFPATFISSWCNA